MGNFFSNLIDNIFKKEVKSLMLGLDNSGKSTILYLLANNKIIKTIPTIGFNVEVLNHKNLKMTVWDVGGQDKIRKLWHHYFINTEVLIYVIDSNDSERFAESKNELHYLINNINLKCVLIYLNKTDLPNTILPEKIKDIFELNKIKYKWFVQPCCAINNEGIIEGLEWISKNIK